MGTAQGPGKTNAVGNMTSRRPRPSVRPLLAFFFMLLGASSALLQLGGIATKAPATATKRAPATAARRGWRATPPPGPSARAARRRRLVARFALPISRSAAMTCHTRIASLNNYE